MAMAAAKSLGNKVVLAKIPREEFSRFQQHCDVNGETINSYLRKLILSEINNPHPSRIAGRSVFKYSKNKDNFSWKVELDDGEVCEIDGDLPASTLEQLHESLINAVEERNLFIRKNKNNSVALPKKLTGSRK